MRNGILCLLAIVCLGSGAAVAADNPKDVFKGKLFAPNVILENRDQLNLSKDDTAPEVPVRRRPGRSSSSIS